MPSLTTLAGAGVWAASAVKVAGYVFQSYSDTYSQFPAPGSGGTGGLASGGLNPFSPNFLQPQLPGPGKNIPKGTPGAGTGTNALGEGGSVPAGKGITAPPAWLINPLKMAVYAGHRNLVRSYWSRVLTWERTSAEGRKWAAASQVAGAPGMSVAQWITSQPWGPKWLDLSGYTLIQTQ